MLELYLMGCFSVICFMTAYNLIDGIALNDIPYIKVLTITTLIAVVFSFLGIPYLVYKILNTNDRFTH